MSIEICNDKSKLNKKYTLNENYFDIINTESKAYFLGLMYADGYNDEKRGCVSIQLQDRDKDILDIFNVELKTDRPLSFSKGRKINHRNYYRLNIVSKRISKKLAELGCVQAKSLILEFPTEEQVPNYLIKHFIRGYFDGDGCIYFNDRISSCNIVSTKSFLLNLQSIINKECNIKSTVYNQKKSFENNNITMMWRINGFKSMKIFLEWLYEDSKVFLERKYLKWIDFIGRCDKMILSKN